MLRRGTNLFRDRDILFDEDEYLLTRVSGNERAEEFNTIAARIPDVPDAG
jgi:hypothetical protein